MAKRIFVMLISTAIALAGVFAEEEPVKMPEDVPANVLEDKPADEAAAVPAKKQGVARSWGGGQSVISELGGGHEYSVSSMGQSVNMAGTTPQLSFGEFIFFDMQYVELTGGVFYGAGKIKQTQRDPLEVEETELKIVVEGLTFGILGKVPIAVSPKLSLFPLLGVDGILMLLVKNTYGAEYANLKGKKASTDFSALWFKAGCGLDYVLVPGAFIRVEALYGIRLPTAQEKEMMNYLDQISGGMGTAKPILGHGFTIKTAFGVLF